jgi:hypothetical protein
VYPDYVEAYARGYVACRRGEKPEPPSGEPFKQEWLQGYQSALQAGEMNKLNKQQTGKN